RTQTLAFLSIVTALIACPGVSARRSCSSIPECQTVLEQRSRAEKGALSKLTRRGQRPTRKVAIVGDGIAGIAAAANFTNQEVRIYGRPSFWLALADLPNVWQTDLTWSYRDAGLLPPSLSGGRRLLRDTVILANLQNLVRLDAAYLA